MDPLFTKTTNFNYGQNWVSNSDYATLKDLGENAIKLHYLEKSYKSKRKIERETAKVTSEDDLNEKFKYDKNAIVSKKFPFKAEDFKYPNSTNEKPKSLYIKYSEEYGKFKPNNLELPEKYFPIDNTFTKRFTTNFKNNSLNTAASLSKVHKAFDSVY